MWEGISNSATRKQIDYIRSLETKLYGMNYNSSNIDKYKASIIINDLLSKIERGN